MNETQKLEKQLKQLKSKQEEEAKIKNLKSQISAIQKQQKTKHFAKKHPFLNKIADFGEAGGKALTKMGKKITTPPSPKKQKKMKKAQEDLKRLINMY